MAMVNANFIDYDSHYYRMIGEWDITPEDAFKRFYNFFERLQVHRYIPLLHEQGVWKLLPALQAVFH